jgi:hypothetical protein
MSFPETSEKSIFLAALEIASPRDRQAYLDEVCRHLMSRRIDGLFDTTKPSSGTNVIAQLRSCVQKAADKKKAAKQLVRH